MALPRSDGVRDRGGLHDGEMVKMRYRTIVVSATVAYFINSIWYRGVTAPATWLDVLTPFVICAAWIGASRLDARQDEPPDQP